MTDQSTTDGEGVAKVHARHSCKRIDEFSFHPDALRVVMANCVEKAILLGKEPWWHARTEDECGESKKVNKGYRSSGNGKGVMRRRKVIVLSDEATKVNHDTRMATADAYLTVPGMCIGA